MANANLLKGGVIVVVLLAALAAFDALDNNAYSQATGAAVSTLPPKCDESDTGKDYYTRGTISYNPDSKGNYKNTYEENCAGSTLNEYYCDNGVARTAYFTCAKGCKDGACLQNCVLEEGKATCVVDEGQSYSVSMGGELYEISADFVGSTSAKLTVNGEVTSSLGVGEFQTLADGAILEVLKLTTDNLAGGERSVEFVINRNVMSVRCSEGEEEYLAQWGQRHYLGPEGRKYDIYVESMSNTGAKLRVTARPSVSTETTVVSEVNIDLLGEHIFDGVAGEVISIKTFKPVIIEDKLRAIRFCLQKSGGVKSFVNAEWECYDGSVGVTGGSAGICRTYSYLKAQADEACKAHASGVSTFSLKGECKSTSSNTLILKADSFSVIALGAAFGNYYEPLGSTCKPDDIFLASWVYAPTTGYDEETGEQYESTYQNIMLFEVDADSRLAVKPNGHDYALRRLKFSEKGRTTFNWSEAAGAWILNEGPECTLAFTYDSEKMWKNVQAGYALPLLAKDANFVSVVPQMIGKSLEQVKGDCELTGAYSNFGHIVPSASDARTVGGWDWWTPKHEFAQNELGLGMWLYSDNACRLDFS